MRHAANEETSIRPPRPSGIYAFDLSIGEPEDAISRLKSMWPGAEERSWD
ncbi:MAG: hypothetical protein QOH48_2109 [Actinomycetota bacterium]|jgi:hypothetical protein|nr:hypothetical protein [Actinomycetota bacterium]